MAHINAEPFANVEAGFAYFESFTNLERQAGAARTPLRLDRMRRLLAAFDNPERAFRAIHLAGSKGKGSTATFVARILMHAGFRVGLYTSPHLRDYRERITIGGRAAEDARLLVAFNAIRRHVEATYPSARSYPNEPNSERAEQASDPDSAERPTTFELLTLLAFVMFRESGCDWAVIETGLGGRLDATNVLEPVASVITRIEREHTEYLGEEIEEIAAEKAGIIKRGVPVFVSDQTAEAREVILRHAASVQAPVFELSDALEALEVEITPAGTTVRIAFIGRRELVATLRLIGRIQAHNAALAVLLTRSVLPDLTDDAVTNGIAEAWLPARGELLDTTPAAMLDGAHTPASVAAVAREFAELFRSGRTLVFGAVRGKDYEAMAEALSPLFDHVIIARPGTFKPSDLDEIAETFRRFHHKVELRAEPETAWDQARSYGQPILVTGSFYLVAEIYGVLDRKHT